MKRSEMLNSIANALIASRLCEHDMLKTASIVLRNIENAGVLPPTFLKHDYVHNMAVLCQEWEKEVEK